MKKNLVIIIVVVLVVLAIGWLVLVKGKGGAAPIGEIKKEAGEEGEVFTGKIKQMIERGIAMKCTYTQGDFSGTGFVKGRNYYGEVRGPGQKGYVIIKDDCLWSWGEGQSQGIKMCPEGDIWEAQEGQETQVPIEVEYRCVPAVFSDAQFNPPAGVNFMEMEEMMKGIPGTEE